VTSIKTASPLGDQAIMWVFAYQVDDVVFDGGCANAIPELRAFLAKRDVNRVFVTHLHEDHYGGCAAFLPKASLYAGPRTIEAIEDPYEIPEFFQWVWGKPNPIQDVEAMPSEIPVGELTFEVVDLSGHCEEMVGFWEPEKRWLFSADAVPLASKKHIAMAEENVPKMIRRMREIQQMGVKILFDGHRGPISNPQNHIQTRIDYLTELQRKIQDLHNTGKSLQDIKLDLKFPEPWYLSNTDGRFGVDYLIESLLSDEVIL
ncbi:MAG: MBL fold metallo-hydrolase, partial [Candidatus Thorarchaeota archaeon]